MELAKDGQRRVLIITTLISTLAFVAATTISPPDGSSIDFVVQGKGFQIYSCMDPNNTGHLSWSLQRAEAELYDVNSHILLGFHYFLPKPDAGGGRPTWSLLQNPGIPSNNFSSTVTGKVVSKAPGGQGNVDELLVQATSHSGCTRLSKVSYIQRLQTRGGVADLCQVQGTTQAVPYESEYVFWTRQQSQTNSAIHAVDSGDRKSPETRPPPLLLFAEGFQHYRFNGSAWELFNATALLYSIPGKEVAGEHFFLENKDSRGGQPTWSTFGPPSSVTAKVWKTARAAMKGSISWVDLEATSNSGDERSLGTVMYVERRSTGGGVPPEQVTETQNAGDVFLSPYTAVWQVLYCFFLSKI